MEFTVYRTLSEMDSLAGEWNDLLNRSATRVPFLRHDYLTTWWQTMGGGEWKQGELLVVAARDARGKLIGIAPLFFTQNRQGEPALMLLGSIEISDYLDLIATSEVLPDFVDGLLAFLGDLDQLPWKALDWYNLFEESATLPVLKQAAQRRGWEFSQERLQPAPYIPLPEDWESYLAGLDKKQRHEIRRKMRRAEQNTSSVRWYIVEDGTTLASEMEAFFQLMAYDQQKEAFLTAEMRRQMQTLAEKAFAGGWLQLAFLEVDGQKAAAYLNFDCLDHIWVYNSGLNYDLGYISPGWVLLGYLIQWAIQHKRRAFDFMRGNESYKYHFGGIDRFVARVLVRR